MIRRQCMLHQFCAGYFVCYNVLPFTSWEERKFQVFENIVATKIF
jgi:hypothetical protein